MTPPASSAASAPRPAATVIALADDAHGSAPSLLMVRRSARSPFMPDALVFPGGRVEAEDGPAGSDAGDQRRIVTPKDALGLGSHYLVVGRPITQADNPVEACAAIIASMA